MNISKAIELLQESEKSLRGHKFSDHADAVQMGIEALKREESNRHFKAPEDHRPLPGETK